VRPVGHITRFTPRSNRLLSLAGGIVLIAAIASSFFFNTSAHSRDIDQWLKNRGTIAVIGAKDKKDKASFSPSGTRLVSVDTIPALVRALASQDLSQVVDAMDRSNVRGLFVEGESKGSLGEKATVMERVMAYDRILGMRGVVFSSEASLYINNPVEELPAASKEAIAVVARGIIGGAKPPRVTSFPQFVQRARDAEVMVILRQGTHERLWRSAKGNSIARALITSCTTARKRWMERERAMGGRLDDLLTHLDIDIFLLEDDGTVLTRDDRFIDRVFTKENGIAYQWRGTWRFLLPAATAEAGKGSAVRAYQKLLRENALPLDSLQRKELRLYRLAVTPLAESPAP
jgi:hypothetical protein